MNKLFVDTSGWANLFIPTEIYHKAASQYFQEAYRQNQEIVTSNYVIAELVSLLNVRLKASRSQQFTYIDTIKTSEKVMLIYLDQRIDTLAWNLCKSRPDKAWSLVDCTSFIIMQQLGIQVALTTDSHFEQAGLIRLLKPSSPY